jgi:hypothetical protein
MLIENKSICNINGCKKFNEVMRGPSVLPEIVWEIFSHFNLASLGASCLVSKAWKQLADDPILWKNAIYRDVAFGNDKWAKCFGPDAIKDEDSLEEFASLPWQDYIEDCKKFKNIFPEKKGRGCLMLVRLPKTFNGGLTLKSLGELAKKYFSNNEMGYRFIWSPIVEQLGDKSIDKSYWLLMTKDVLPGSKNESYHEQQKIVANLAVNTLMGYDVPETLESAACILLQYFGSNIRLFSMKPITFTRCKEQVQGNQTVVGGFAPSGLTVYRTCNDSRFTGVAALRKF